MSIIGCDFPLCAPPRLSAVVPLQHPGMGSRQELQTAKKGRLRYPCFSSCLAQNLRSGSPLDMWGRDVRMSEEGIYNPDRPIPPPCAKFSETISESP